MAFSKPAVYAASPDSGGHSTLQAERCKRKQMQCISRFSLELSNKIDLLKKRQHCTIARGKYLKVLPGVSFTTDRQSSMRCVRSSIRHEIVHVDKTEVRSVEKCQIYSFFSFSLCIFTLFPTCCRRAPMRGKQD